MIDEIVNIWNTIAPYFIGTTLGSAIFVSLIAILRAAIIKKIDGVDKKLDAKTFAKEMFKYLKEQLKTMTIEQNIQPIVNSELQKINEASSELVKEELKLTQENYYKLINVVEKLAAYFDNSIGVSEEAKQDLRNAVLAAKEMPSSTFVSTLEISEPEKVEEIVIEKKSKKKTAEIER